MPPSDLGLCGQSFSKLYKNTNGAFTLQLSIGPWTWSANFSLTVRTVSSRNSLATSIVNLLSWESLLIGNISLMTVKIMGMLERVLILLIRRISLHLSRFWGEYLIKKVGIIIRLLYVVLLLRKRLNSMLQVRCPSSMNGTSWLTTTSLS
jgi:hypothetical protein